MLGCSRHFAIRIDHHGAARVRLGALGVCAFHLVLDLPRQPRQEFLDPLDVVGGQIAFADGERLIRLLCRQSRLVESLAVLSVEHEDDFDERVTAELDDANGRP